MATHVSSNGTDLERNFKAIQVQGFKGKQGNRLTRYFCKEKNKENIKETLEEERENLYRRFHIYVS